MSARLVTFAAAAAVAAFAALAAFVACGPPTTGQQCTAGDLRCSENVYQTCADDGERWVVSDDCNASGTTCSVGPGCVVCFAGLRTCDGLEILRCRPDGSGNDVIAACDPALGETCFAGDCRDACELSAEAKSYEGCEYWAVDLDNAVVANQGTASAQQYSVVLSNASLLPAEVHVEIYCTAADALNPALQCTEGAPFTVAGPFTIAPGGLKIVDLDPRELDGSSLPQLNDGPGTFRSHHAYHVVSTAPLIAYQFNPLENVNVFSNDASLLLPQPALGSKYLVLSWPQTLALTDNGDTNGGIDLRAFLTIVGTKDDTHLSVTLSTDILPGADIPAGFDGETLDFELDAFEVLNLETDGFNADFTSSRIVADQPVAVFTGSEASDVPRFDSFLTRQCCADHLEEQLFPETSFGRRFVAVKTPLRSPVVDAAGWNISVVPDEPEWWRVLATGEDTVVTTNLPPPNDSFFLTRGQSVIFASERDFVMTATRAISFAQFPGSQQTTGIPSTIEGGLRPPGGDPSMILIPPIEQWRTHYLFLVPNKYAFDFLLIAAPVDADILYDGLPIDDLLSCARDSVGVLYDDLTQGEVEYLGLRCQLSFPTVDGPGLQDDGVHTIESATGDRLGLVVWGWDSFVSYGYPAGTNVDLINLE